MSELLHRSLPKWPQMLVSGKPVTPEQAMEIIRRTDSFFDYASGNNHAFIKRAKQILHLKDYDDFKTADGKPDYQAYREWHDSYHAQWGTVTTEYVKNDWISCSFIGGPHGWCHPDGTILYYDNVGKWPSVEAIFSDWQILAGAFPFLDVALTLINGESCEENEEVSPVVSMRVLGGNVTLHDPSEEVHQAHGYTAESLRQGCRRIDTERGFPVIFGGGEKAISPDALETWYRQVFGGQPA